MKIGVSSGSATVMELHKARCREKPTTIYLLLGEECQNRCSFCCRWRKGNNTLSRVSWPFFELDEVLKGIAETFDKGFVNRVCLQVTDDGKEYTDKIILKIITEIRKSSPIDISISAGSKSGEFMEKAFSLGVSNIALPIDVANEGLFKKIKKRDFITTLNTLLEFSDRYQEKMTTHLIVGLGESEKDLLELLALFNQKQITTGLFAFTPVRGSEMEYHPPPPIAYYRKIQLLKWLINNNMSSYFSLEGGIIKFDQKIYSEVSHKNYSQAFETSGCSSCNRPFYNEKPGHIPYNYPRELTYKEAVTALKAAMGINTNIVR